MITCWIVAIIFAIAGASILRSCLAFIGLGIIGFFVGFSISESLAGDIENNSNARKITRTVKLSHFPGNQNCFLTVENGNGGQYYVFYTNENDVYEKSTISSTNEKDIRIKYSDNPRIEYTHYELPETNSISDYFICNITSEKPTIYIPKGNMGYYN